MSEADSVFQLPPHDHERAPAHDEQEEPRTMTDRETMSDLKAAVGARRELGPEMEDEVLEDTDYILTA